MFFPLWKKILKNKPKKFSGKKIKLKTHNKALHITTETTASTFKRTGRTR